MTLAKGKSVFSYSDIYDPSFKPLTFNPIWIKGSQDFLFRNSSGNMYRFLIANKTAALFLSRNVFVSFGSTYSISADLKYVLFASGVSMRYRRSYRAQYIIYEIATDSHIRLAGGATVEYAGWGPKNNSLSYVDSDNNLHYHSSASSASQKLTTSGSSIIFNGIPDWLYEEDVIESRVAHYWSTDGSFICYAETNDTGVRIQDVPYYGESSDVYGKTISIPYPKAGDVINGKLGQNPKVTMYAVNLNTLDKFQLDPPNEVQNEPYFISVYWKNDKTVMITWANRQQNRSVSMLYDLSSGPPPVAVTKNLDYTTAGGWIQMSDTSRIFIENGERYLMVFPKGNSPNTVRLPHVMFTTPSVNATPLIKELYETDKILAYDANGVVYFLTTFGDPSERHIASVGIPYTPSSEIPLKCLTCNNGDKCRYLSASFSDDAFYYIEACLGPDVPVYTLRSTINNNYVVIMENNDLLRSSAEEKLLPTVTYFNFSSSGFEHRAEIYVPPNPAEDELFKMLVYTYAGPGTQLVLKTYPLGSSTANWLTYLSSTHRIAVVSIDGRGAAGRGDRIKFQMYKNMGTVEVEDQIAGASEAMSRFPWLDAYSNAAIFGWSYGGFTTAHAVADSSDFFTCGISVAPVTDQAFYDTAYAERYLGLDLPGDGQDAYKASSVLNKIDGFKDKIYMIAHGMADDNVHYMNTAHLIRSLEDADILFDQITYPDEAHGISTPTRNNHLYHSMTYFLTNRCWSSKAVTLNPSTLTFGLVSCMLIFAFKAA